MYAIDNGETDAMNMLVRAGADTSIKNHDGKTAIALLKEMHPDRYNEWTCKLKKEMLEHEDNIGTDLACSEPDFSL